MNYNLLLNILHILVDTKNINDFFKDCESISKLFNVDQGFIYKKSIQNIISKYPANKTIEMNDSVPAIKEIVLFDLGLEYTFVGKRQRSLIEEEYEAIAVIQELIKFKITRTYDMVTALINRHTFIFLIEEKLRISTLPFSIIMVDINQFKKINDQYGYKIGDSALNKVADSLIISLSSWKDDNLVARYSADEFLIYVQNDQVDSFKTLITNIQFSIDQIAIPVGNDILKISVTFSRVLSSETPSLSLKELLEKLFDRIGSR